MVTGRAPDFDLPIHDGGRTTLKELLASGPVLLAFYKGSCPTCRLTLPFLERLHRGQSGGGLQVVAISQDDADASMEFNRNYGITFATLIDPHEPGVPRYPASNAYAITNVPSLFLVEQDGSISQSVAGFEKAQLESLGQRFGVTIFGPSERVPVYQPG